MATYVIPQVLVYQDFQTNPAAASTPLQSHISGGHAQLVRYTVSDEKANGLLGVYDSLENTNYDWPNIAVGGQIDLTYVQLYMQNALLQYYQGTAGGEFGAVKVAGQLNQVRCPSVNLTANGANFPLNPSLYDRGVKTGDPVLLRFLPEDADPVTFWSYVTGFVGDPIGSIIGSPTDDADNAATHGSATYTAVQTAGPWNAVEITDADAAAYNPYPTGEVSETYTIIVTGSSTHGNFTEASLRVISASGLDDVASVTPSASGSPTAIGSLGLTVTFEAAGGDGASESASDQGVSPDDLLVGQRFVVTVNAEFTATPAPTAGGTYTGTSTTTYIVAVVAGAKFADSAPQIQVSTANGIDISGPTSVNAADSAVAIGTLGVTLSFSGDGLALGDRFNVPVTSSGVGAMRTLVLANTIPSSIPDDTEADITLFIENTSLLVPQDKLADPPQQNYVATETEITVNASMTAYDPSWTLDGVQQPLPLASDVGQNYGVLYVTYRAWVQDLCYNIGVINDVGLLDTQISGTLDPDNPLKWAVAIALQNSNGTNVTYTSVCNPSDLSSWTNMLDILVGSDQVYGLVPLTHDPNVWNLFQAHVDDQSSAENGAWRVAWFSLQGIPTIPIVSNDSTVAGYTTPTTSDGNPALATIVDDPNTAGTQYTIVTVTTANALFITNGVRAGDIVRTGYSGDGFGNYTYQSYTVNAVITEESLQLVTGPGAAVNTPSKIEVYRNLNATDQATAIAQIAGAFSDRRIRCVWPDTIDDAGVTVDGWNVCAALAGLRSGILPNQGMTNLAVAGFESVPRTTMLFNSAQLNIMAVSGVWIVTQSSAGEIYTRDALTTGLYTDLNQREEMITSNLDSISFQLQSVLAPFIGISNVTPSLINLLRLEILGQIQVLQTIYNQQLGGQMGPNAVLVDIRQHLTLKDRVVVIVNPDLPYPLDNVEFHLSVAAATAVDPSTLTSGTLLSGQLSTNSTTG